jgi:hypothetical protein
LVAGLLTPEEEIQMGLLLQKAVASWATALAAMLLEETLGYFVGPVMA